MNITVLCSSKSHPIMPYLDDWVKRHGAHHDVKLVQSKQQLEVGDLLLLISCAEILTREDRAGFTKTLVIHASDLPHGRGWSPHIWQVLEGSTSITVTLLEAEDAVDSGDIWQKISVDIPKHALWDEINARIFSAEMRLMDYAITHFHDIEPEPQNAGVQSDYYRKRTPEDSRLDPGKSIEEQFDLIRVCDPDRYPAFFDLHGKRYILRLEKLDEE